MIYRPPLRYPGGKFRLAPWVISHFPAHHTYVELFGGAASILLLKPRSGGEVYNDIESEVVNVFRVLRDPVQAKELARLLELTPYARDEYDLAYQHTDDPVEAARRMIFRSFAGHGSDSVTRSHAGFRGHRNKESGVTGANDWLTLPAQIMQFTQRLQGVVIENRDAMTVARKFDRSTTLFYADPPYLNSVRGCGSVRYKSELKTDAEHSTLADELHQLKGMVIVSGYPSDLYTDLYADWRMVQTAHHAQNAKLSIECLWLSPNIQTTLF